MQNGEDQSLMSSSPTALPGRGSEREREWIRLREVLRLTGWDRWYVRTLEENNVLETRRHHGKAKRWYRRSQVMELIK